VDNLEFKDRLKDLRNEYKKDRYELAKFLNVSYSTIAKYESGLRSPDKETLNKLANYFNVSVDYLLGRTDIRNTDTLKKAGLYEAGEMVPIPIVGNVKAGKDGTIAFEDYLGEEKVEKEAVKDGERYFLLRVKGDSMYPEIKEGDLVLVRQQSDVDSGDYAVVIINGDEGIVKRLIKKDSSIILQSINPTYDPIIITNSEDLIIVGKVKRVIRIY
jgi:repressor LexA